ncbi:uncharacterized mitochondrial protein-like protein [Tanacetum coccineum]
MSMMGELKFFLGIQIHQSPRGIFVNQAKYAQEILKKHGMTSCDSIGTPMATKHLDADLSASRPDIVHATCYCARYQAKPIEKHITAVKRIFRYHKDSIHIPTRKVGDYKTNIYKFKEGDLKRLQIQDIEDMLLLFVQGKLTNLTVKERLVFNVTLRISDLKRRDAYSTYSTPRGFIYQNKDKKNRLRRIDELYKFSDGTLDDVRTALNDRLKGIRMQYLVN